MLERDLELTTNLTGWRIFVRRKHDRAFTPIAQKIFERDGYTCYYCGFQAKEYQEIINLDGNYLNNKGSNLATCCCFCSQCLFLQATGMDDMSGGQLIYLPEISQANLNSFCHVLFCALGNNSAYGETAQNLYRSFKFRSQIIEDKFGAGTTNPNTMGQLLIEYSITYPQNQPVFMKDIRLLPLHTKFRVQLDAWAQAALKELEPEGNS